MTDDGLGIPEFLRRVPGDRPKPVEIVVRPEITAPTPEPKKKREAPVGPGVTYFVREAVSRIVGEVEGMIDDGTTSQVYDFLLRSDAKELHAKGVVKKFEPILAEAREALAHGADPQLREGYETNTPAGRERALAHVAVLETIISETNRYLWFRQVAHPRATRKPKRRSADKQVATLRYLPHHAELQLVSVKPTDVVGAMGLWTYDVRTRVLSHFVARTRDGLGAKGASLRDFDLDVSTSKVLRKPEETLPKVLSGGKPQLSTLMKTLTTKAKTPNGRMSGTTVLLRTTK